jgi:hypothetical protein
MLLDYILLIVGAVIGMLLTVIAGFVATEKRWARALFLMLSPMLLATVVWQGVRQINSQSSADSAYMSLERISREERRQSDTKVDSLFALLQGKIVVTPPPRRPEISGSKPTSENLRTTDSVSWVKVTHEERPSARSDAPFAQELLLQVSNHVSPVRVVVTCNKDVVDGDVVEVGALVSYSKGVMANNPKVFVVGYQFPPLTPRRPLGIMVWTKQKATCQAQMF